MVSPLAQNVVHTNKKGLAMHQDENHSTEANSPVALQDEQLDDAQGGVGIIAAPVSPIKTPVSKDYTCSGGTCE